MNPRCFLLSALLLSFDMTGLAQSVPQLVNYQGRLASPDGLPFPTADYELRISVHDAAAGGNLIWGPQVFDGAVGPGHGPKIPVLQGYFNVMLGPVDTDGHLLLEAFGSSNRYVEVTVSNRPPISPRQRILSTPYAIHAGNGSPPGSISAYGGSSVPEGWLLCDGRVVTSNQFPRLWAAIGISWGGSGPAGFNLPDLRGLFLRGVDNSPNGGASGQDPDVGSRIPTKPGGNAGPNVGSFQSATFARHDHGGGNHTHSHGSGPGYQPGIGNYAPFGLIDGGALRYTWVRPGSFLVGIESIQQYPIADIGIRNSGGIIASEGGSETRPRNAYVNYIIKY